MIIIEEAKMAMNFRQSFFYENIPNKQNEINKKEKKYKIIINYDYDSIFWDHKKAREYWNLLPGGVDKKIITEKQLQRLKIFPGMELGEKEKGTFIIELWENKDEHDC
jgi:hypothetical protein